ncbi:MAG TPA: hypothetical protein VGP87_02935 [Gemmatimonadales bacterium]|nr:hypothetical protein [Gemmatimonadales bacterium]
MRPACCGVALLYVILGVPSPGAAPARSQGAAGQLNATVTETLLGAFQSGGKFVVSPDGGHLATFSTHGSREVIVVDGVDGPEFDDAGRPNPGSGVIDVAFSPDGKRSAYIAQKGDLWVAVVDGKEAFTVTGVKPNSSVPGIDQSYIHSSGEGHQPPRQFLFSQSGAHVAVVAQDPTGMYMFLDGVKSPAYTSIDLRQVVFVGDRLVYVASTADHKWHAVVNTTPGPGYDRLASLQLSDNGQHFALIGSNGAASAIITGGATGPAPPVITGTGVSDLVIASTGQVGYLGAAGTSPHGPLKTPLYVGSQQVYADTPAPFFGTFPGTGEQKSGVHIVFSPDGSKFAYAKQVPGGVAAVIDGKTSIAYDAIGQMHFSPDSKRAYFVGMKSGLEFVVIDGQEMQGQSRVGNIGFSADGSRFGYESQTSVVIDGKESGALRGLIEKSLTFSADGKHSAYVVCAQYTQCQLVKDGTATPMTRPADFNTRTGPPHFTSPAVAFSPDGTRLVTNLDVHAVLIDGKEISHGASYEYPVFSPDSKHFAVMGWIKQAMTLFVDGATGPTYKDIVEANRNVVRFLDAHTLRFLAVKGDSVYRVVMDLK